MYSLDGSKNPQDEPLHCWLEHRPLSPSFCIFSVCRQWTCDGEMLDRYRQALETAVNLSAKHSLPPLPGRTLLIYLVDADADKFCPKSNPQGVKNKFNEKLVGGYWWDTGYPEKVSAIRTVSYKWALRAKIKCMHLLSTVRSWSPGTINEPSSVHRL